MTVQSDPNWDRWVWATMTKEFRKNFSPPTFTLMDVDLFVEGTGREKPDDAQLLEFRMDGPQQRKPSKNKFILEFEINILVRSLMEHGNFHKMRSLLGAVRRWLAQDHCIFRYGSGIVDDDTLLGTLVLQNRSPLDQVRTNYFGQISSEYRIEEATVEGSFKMYLP